MNKSSNLRSANYDPDNQRLTVEFGNGSQYEYDNVPQIYHDGLHQAPSPGTFFHTQIKPRFPARQIKQG